ncbi:hypothetical protein SSS_05479 [Sarcoptes scabiei]|nr:hypothetical protein SSS_05479 [Sarcoptes scabiei]
MTKSIDNQSNDKDSTIRLKQAERLKVFNMRQISLKNFPSTERKCSNRVPAINKFKEDYLTTCPLRSMNYMRRLLQPKINEEINEILMRYQTFFLQPIIANIRENLRENAIAIESLSLNVFMHRILEEAKKLYPLANEDQFLKQLIDDDCRYSEELMNGKSSTIQRNFTINRNNRTRPMLNIIAVQSSLNLNVNVKNHLFKTIAIEIGIEI